ncbi:MAG: tRNA (adenosine(37)-N6)-threonylcarbamoyltransferase complex ATPase subunit type 1 TsaE [Candidatus Zixiibacteriota bacterium]|nr:MAG: tRNA (adenosine(37)-N6)-threonylcarbamoyltransferase complex ATPase subunit type 1 TsaE [candidate division Zixibacteria bacterium]
MKKALKIISHSEEETVALARKLTEYFRPGDVIVLTGLLGAGKTVFVKGLAAALGIDESLVNSPSFTLVNEYSGERPLYHLDLYRIRDESELYEIGWDDYLLRDGIVVVEWGEKAAALLPPRYYRVEFTIKGDSEREINISHVQT